MRMKVKDFVIVPLLCPIGELDCSCCRHAGRFTVKTPPLSESPSEDYGEHDCNYLDWFEKEYDIKIKERI